MNQYLIKAQNRVLHVRETEKKSDTLPSNGLRKSDTKGLPCKAFCDHSQKELKKKAESLWETIEGKFMEFEQQKMLLQVFSYYSLER